jgi:hypothetical protein
MEVRNIIQQLLWDKRYIDIPDDYPCPEGLRTVLMKHPTVADRNYYLWVREREEQICVREGVPTEETIFQDARSNGYWDEDDDTVIKKVDEHLEWMRSEAKKMKFSAQKKRLLAQIEATEKEAEVVRDKQRFLKSQTAEYLSHEIAAYALLKRLVLDLDGHLLWNTEEAFVTTKDQYAHFIQYLVYEMLQEGVLDVKTIRQVARSNEWRLLWIFSKESLSDLFNRPLSDLTVNHQLLIFWSRMYDSAFEDTNPPDLEIVEDDEKFDAWLSNREMDRKEARETQQTGKANTKNSTLHHQEQGTILEGEFIETCSCGIGPQRGVGLGMKKPHVQGCKYGHFRKYSQAEKDAIAEQIYGRNTSKVRNHLEREAKTIASQGMVKEEHLRNKDSRQVLGSKTNVIPIYKGRR